MRERSGLWPDSSKEPQKRTHVRIFQKEPMPKRNKCRHDNREGQCPLCAVELSKQNCIPLDDRRNRSSADIDVIAPVVHREHPEPEAPVPIAGFAPYEAGSPGAAPRPAEPHARPVPVEDAYVLPSAHREHPANGIPEPERVSIPLREPYTPGEPGAAPRPEDEHRRPIAVADAQALPYANREHPATETPSASGMTMESEYLVRYASSVMNNRSKSEAKEMTQ